VARTLRLIAPDGAVLIEQCRVADRPLARMRGLLGRSSLPPGEGLLLRPAPSIHTWFMRFPIDAVFLDGALNVVALAHDVPPWRMRSRRGARAVLELAAGEARRRGIREGMTLSLAPGPERAVTHAG
jgi:uncharacterized membrane protein (UPF0127 family)